MNPLYNMYGNNVNVQSAGNFPQQQQQLNPIQKMQQFMQAMQNPIGYLMQKFPDIPPYMQNDPNAIFQYLQQTRNITPDQINQTMRQMPKF